MKKLNRKTLTISAVALVVAILSTIVLLIILRPDRYKTDFERWVNDTNYTDGVLYIEGDKGAEVLQREISNCAYVDCDIEEIKETQGTVKIEVKKPDLKKGVALLIESSKSGNSLAAAKLLTFLTSNINHKTESPDIYLIKQFELDTGLNYEDYKNAISMAWKNGSKSNKCCFCEYIAGELYEYGALGYEKNITKAQKHYKAASLICPDNNIYSMMSKNKAQRLNK